MDGIEIRPLFAPDLANGFAETLSALAPVELDHEGLVRVFQIRLRAGIRTFVAIMEARVVGTASVFIEPKFIRGGGKVAHVEDVAVHPARQRLGIGRKLMEQIDVFAREAGCYKVILDCGDHNVPFYEKLGYRKHGQNMRKDI